MAMGLVLLSIVTGLSLLGDDVSAASLSTQQQQFLRQWLMKNENNASQLTPVAWQPSNDAAAVAAAEQHRDTVARSQRRSRLGHRVLKAGYAGDPPSGAAFYLFKAPGATMHGEPASPYGSLRAAGRSSSSSSSSNPYSTHAEPASAPSKSDEQLSGASYRVVYICLLYTSPSPRDRQKSRMPSSA